MDPLTLYSNRDDSYHRFVNLFRYPQAIRAYFLKSPHLRSGLKVLDAGCGSGIATFALRDALLQRGLEPGSFHAFDLTPAMLHRFRAALDRRAIQDVDLMKANVLNLDVLPDNWTNYDLIVSASMLEYLPRPELIDGLRALHSRLGNGGKFILFITRNNWLTRPLIGRWWHANLYDRQELEESISSAGFKSVSFHQFPGFYRVLSLWGYIVEAER